jgi:hypothetical protein
MDVLERREGWKSMKLVTPFDPTPTPTLTLPKSPNMYAPYKRKY